YSGPPLAGYYDTWVLPWQERLNQRAYGVASCLTSAWETARDQDRALLYARKMVELDLLGEEANATLIRLLLETDRSIEARRQFRRWEYLLATTLGEKPPAAIRTLLKSARPDPEANPPSAASAHSPPVLLPPRLTRFFGREEEMERVGPRLTAG